MKRNLRISGTWAAIGAVALCVVIPASAQVPPPDRDSNGRDSQSGRDNAPHYVDHADYDPQPYYVDGVEYKPYVPDKKKAKPAADTVKAASTPITPNTADATTLHPYLPTPVSKPGVSAGASNSALADASSSDTSSSSYAPKKRPRYAVAIIEALDKITAEHVKFEAPIGQPVRYKGLIYTVKACETTADDEPQFDVMAYMSVRTNPVSATNTAPMSKSKEIFHGWTFASTPSLNPIKHANYDAWVVACRKPLQPISG